MIFIYRGISYCIAALPLRAALALGRLLGWIFGSVLRYHRHDALDSLARAMPDLSETERKVAVDTMYANLGMNIVEMLRQIKMDQSYLENHVEWDGIEHIRDALQEGRGVCILTAHIGNWELLCSLYPYVNRIPMNIIAKPVKGKSMQRYLQEIRSRYGMGVLPAKGAYRECIRRLRRGEVLAFVLDQNMIRREGEFVEFFGRPACTTLGLAHMAAQAGCPVVPAFAFRKPGGKHKVITMPALRAPANKEVETLAQHTAEYTGIIEDVIRKDPSQWIWIHRRWKTSPAADDVVFRRKDQDGRTKAGE